MRRSRPAGRTTGPARPLQFGVAVAADPDRPGAAVEVARWAEDVGLDWLGVRDRPGTPRFLDTWTVLATLVPATHRLGLYPDVAGAPLPQPAVLAAAAGTLHRLAAGRVALEVGAGWLWDAVHAYGGPRLSPSDCADAFEKALRTMRAAGEGVPAPELWCATQGARMLRATGRLGDGWVASAATLDDVDLAAGQALLDDMARRTGRPPSAVRRLLTVPADALGRTGGAALAGRVVGWWERLGFDTVVLGPAAAGDPRCRRWAEEVVPAVRERAAARTFALVTT